jgi:hypothetical protein
MIQPKYKIHDKVRAKYAAPFKIIGIRYCDQAQTYFYLYDNACESIAEPQLELVVEPMVAEFDYRVLYSIDELVGLISSTELHKFIGKKVLVKVTEVL